MDRLLIDTNIILDYLLTRTPFYEAADKLIQECMKGTVRSCIAAHSFPNMFYILRKDFTVEERKKLLKNLCTLFDVEGIDQDKIIKALDNEDFSDFEDRLQVECAVSYAADYIITRNLSDFTESPVKAITPEEYLESMKEPHK